MTLRRSVLWERLPGYAVRTDAEAMRNPGETKSGSSSFGRALAFQAGGGGFEPRLPLCKGGDRRMPVPAAAGARFCRKGQPAGKSRCSSVVEHFLGKEEVVSSILINGSG